jgi:uroporphyrin-III C-methyltransferase/precorrin-2 dehydrogenase/sirohydrochlorin ferrochelatase
MRETRERLAVFPTFTKVAGRPVVVVGSGDEAAAKVRLLSETDALIRVFAEVPDAALLSAVDAAGAELIRRPFEAGDLSGAALAFGATGDLAADRAVVEAARAAGVPANAVDRPELCDFYTPALVCRAPIAVAIGSEGTGPVLARHIRAKIEAMLPARLGRLARIADGFRAAVADRVPHGAPRRRFWARFFDGPVADLILSGREAEGRSAATRLLEVDHATTGYVYLVGAGPGAEDLLTLRAQRLLQEADVIVIDSLVPDAVVAMGRRDAERIYVGKRKGRHSASQDEINAVLIREAAAGHRVVRLKSGDPLVFGRAGEEMAALRAAGVPFEVVPGVTAAFAAAASAGIPLTLRGVASSLVFATGHDQNEDTLPDWAGLALSGATVAVYMGKTVAAQVANRLIGNGMSASTPVAVIENAARGDERLLAGTLDELAGLGGRDDLTGPTLIVVGAVVAHGVLANAEPLRLAEAIAA